MGEESSSSSADGMPAAACAADKPAESNVNPVGADQEQGEKPAAGTPANTTMKGASENPQGENEHDGVGTAKSEPKTETTNDPDLLADEFASFLDDLDNIEKTKPVNRPLNKPLSMDNVTSDGKLAETHKSKLPAIGTADEQCQRLTSKTFGNAYEILLLSPESTEEDLKKMYRKISLLVHPDKCSNPLAQEAFQVITKAYEELQKPEYKDKYARVIKEAERRVIALRKAENKRRVALRAELLSLESDAIQPFIIAMCDKMLSELEEHKQYAEKVRGANERFEQMEEERVEAEEQHEKEERREWEQTRNTRVAGWRNFKDDVATKKIKVNTFQTLKVKKEVRTGKESESKEAKQNNAKGGIDESYKANWR
eukprot:Selendium_serpulae@DN6118_c0_g1_i1.p2